jgi:formiminoglutamate deiminase
VGEFHYIHHDVSGAPYNNLAELAERIATAAEAAGIGLTLLPVFYAHAGFGGRAPDPAQRRFINDVERFARLLEATRRAVAGQQGAIVGVAPHSLRAATPAELDAVVALAGDGPIHLHIAEQTREVDDCIAWSGQRPLQWLFDHADVDRRWCLVHATQALPEEIRAMAASGAVAGLCPITEANLGDGTFQAPDYLAQHGVFGIGTDSNVLIGVSDELRQLEYSQRLARQVRNAVTSEASLSTGRALFDGALKGGSQALGIKEVGLVEGASADIVALDADNAALAAREGDAILDSLVFAARRSPVEAVWVRGQRLVSDGRHYAHEAIASRYRATLQRLLRA